MFGRLAKRSLDALFGQIKRSVILERPDLPLTGPLRQAAATVVLMTQLFFPLGRS
jgi:hypothetical protein